MQPSEVRGVTVVWFGEHHISSSRRIRGLPVSLIRGYTTRRTSRQIIDNKEPLYNLFTKTTLLVILNIYDIVPNLYSISL